MCTFYTEIRNFFITKIIKDNTFECYWLTHNLKFPRKEIVTSTKDTFVQKRKLKLLDFFKMIFDKFNNREVKCVELKQFIEFFEIGKVKL